MRERRYCTHFVIMTLYIMCVCCLLSAQIQISACRANFYSLSLSIAHHNEKMRSVRLTAVSTDLFFQILLAT